MSKANKQSTPKEALSKKLSSQTVASAADNLAKVTINAATRPQYKNIDVVAEYEKAKSNKKGTSFVVVGKLVFSLFLSFSLSSILHNAV
jgi:hypothetical protein